MIKTYVPIVKPFQAVQFTRDNWDEVLQFTENRAKDLTIPRSPSGIASCGIPSLFGFITVREGDFIIKVTGGWYDRIEEKAFLSSYDEVEETTNG